MIYYIESHGRQTMREQLTAGEANAEESLKMALEWFSIEEEVWSGPRHTSENRRFPAGATGLVAARLVRHNTLHVPHTQPLCVSTSTLQWD